MLQESCLCLHAACKAAQRVVDFCANSAPIEGINNIDVVHNIGVTASAMVKALTLLRDNVDSDLTELLTKPENSPVPTVTICANGTGDRL